MKSQLVLQFLLWYPLSHVVFGDSQFRSRPDLSPPRLNISIAANSDVEKGYIFVAPYRGFIQDEGHDGPEQAGAYIFRNNGDLVWSSLGYLAGWVGNFQATRWRGQDVLQGFQGTLDSFHGHGYGHPSILDQSYESIGEFRGKNHKVISIHEFRIVDEKTALVEIYQPLPMDLSASGGNENQKWIVDAIVQEFDLETQELIFEWHSLDHVEPNESAIPLTSGAAFDGVNSSVAWDYIHINSVDKNSKGDYLVSGRHTSTIYKVNGKTGEILWRLGGKKSDFPVTDDVKFAFQHDARFRSISKDGAIEVISFFDNAARSNGHRGGGMNQISDRSYAKFVQLNTTDMTAILLKSLCSPEHILAPSQGNVQLLPNDNVFVNWGQAGAITEFRANDSMPIFHAHLDSGSLGVGVQSYRGFRFNWTGNPSETPAIISMTTPRASKSLVHEGTIIYVSWNGDTETTSWRFYAVGDLSTCRSTRTCYSKKLLGEAPRQSFETTFRFDARDVTQKSSGPLVVFAEALGKDNEVLGLTAFAQTYPDPLLPLGTDTQKVHRMQEPILNF